MPHAWRLGSQLRILEGHVAIVLLSSVFWVCALVTSQS